MNVNASVTSEIRPVSSHTTSEPQRVQPERPQTLENVADAIALDSRVAPEDYCEESVAPFGGE